ncbi:MAG: penicillin-binding protein 2 [Alphaproteobacteria bacterium]|nr:penicillin-binding protein 2 [Alphaproteobacteria bacterium]
MPLFDRKDKSRYASFTRRSLMLSGGMTGVFALLAGRLYQLQIVDGNEYKMEAEDNRVNQRLVAPPRGTILDRFGVELANNRRNYRVVIVAEQATDGVDAALNAIGKIIVLTPRQRDKVLHDIAQNKKFAPVPVVENLSWDEFARINLHLPYLPGVQPDVGETRSYPYGAQLSHVLGYVAAASPDDKKGDDDPLLDLPGFRVGKRGIEKQFDRQMRGKAGASRVEVNAYGRVIRQLSSEPGIPGKDVYLTIDCDLQRYVEQQLGDESAACVVMDTSNGDVLAMASTPGYDPNLFNVGITNEQWSTLLNDDHKPLLNKVIDGSYPPGSTFKTAMALAAVDNGLADLQVNCTGSMMFGGREWHCWAWKKGGHGHVNLHSGIAESCDIFFYEVARRLGIDKMSEAAFALGLGAATGIEMPGELPGLVPTRAWKLARAGVPWTQGDTLNVGIGQGYVLTTPLQLCVQSARIASGKALLPRIVHELGQSLQPRVVPANLPFSGDAFAAVRSGMSAVTNEVIGSAYPWRITQAGFEMAGKTGTAQVRRISKEERLTGVLSNSQMPWNLREHALFIAYAPVDTPRYALSIIIEHGALVSHPHVQMARNILLYAQQRDPVKMPTAYPVHAAQVAPAIVRSGT